MTEGEVVGAESNNPLFLGVGVALEWEGLLGEWVESPKNPLFLFPDGGGANTFAGEGLESEGVGEEAAESPNPLFFGRSAVFRVGLGVEQGSGRVGSLRRRRTDFTLSASLWVSEESPAT